MARGEARATQVDEQPARGPARLLLDPAFGPYFAAKVLSSTGVWVHNVVAAVVVFQLTRSALLVGAVSIAQFLPQILVAPLAGARADRGGRRRQLAGGRLLVAAGNLGLAAWIGVTGLLEAADAAVVIGAALVVGVGFAIGAPAMHAIVPALVRPSELAGAVALNQAPFTIARAAGPALGAGLLVVAGPAPAFVVAGVTNLVFAAIVARVPLRPVERREGGDRSVRAGLRHLRADPVCALLLAAVAAVGFGIDPVITLSPPIAHSLGGGDQLVGALVSAFGVGAGVAVMALGPVRRWLGLVSLGPVGLGLLAVALVWLGLAPTPAWAVAALVAGGIGMMLATTSLTTQLQMRLPEELRGRVMALWSVAFIGSRPFAAAVNGAVADTVGVQVALVIGAVVLLFGAAAVRPRLVDRRADGDRAQGA